MTSNKLGTPVAEWTLVEDLIRKIIKGKLQKMSFDNYVSYPMTVIGPVYENDSGVFFKLEDGEVSLISIKRLEKAFNLPEDYIEKYRYAKASLRVR